VWLKFRDWGREHGPIYQVNIAGTNHIWINSHHIAHTLLAKRILPLLMKLPGWLVPARAWEDRRARTEQRFFEIMQQEHRQRQAAHAADIPSWTIRFLKNKVACGYTSDLEGAFTVGMNGIAGALTIASPIQSFCLALCHYPQYQSVLHSEIDSVVGDDRMPAFDDVAAMPVTRAFIRETMRWRPPVPTGIPHYLDQDDEFEGYHIPAGSNIHPLEWEISRDPELYPDLETFNPLRWLDPKFPTYKEPLETPKGWREHTVRIREEEVSQLLD
jgi:cytochrome P450